MDTDQTQLALLKTQLADIVSTVQTLSNNVDEVSDGSISVFFHHILIARRQLNQVIKAMEVIQQATPDLVYYVQGDVRIEVRGNRYTFEDHNYIVADDVFCEAEAAMLRKISKKNNWNIARTVYEWLV